jgi:hypothetical protein
LPEFIAKIQGFAIPPAPPWPDGEAFRIETP